MARPTGWEGKVGLIWSLADTLRGTFKENQYGEFILPFVVLRRLECALEATKDAVRIQADSLVGKIDNPEPVLRKVSQHSFYNTSPLDLGKILQDPGNVSANLLGYISSFSPGAASVLEKFDFPANIKKLEEKSLLYSLVGKFADLDLSEKTVPNETMGYIYEELLRRFSEMSNETAGEHYTPREVIRLMVSLLFNEDSKALSGNKPVRTLYDPACGTGGMLSIAQEYLHELNPGIVLEAYGQELNDQSWAICRSDLMIKGQDPTRITLGNSLNNEDGHAGKSFDYCISNPPYGDDWKEIQEFVTNESNKGHEGRYGAGLPRVGDGSFLFVQHMLSKMKATKDDSKSDDELGGGSRVSVILSGSPLYAGAAESGESEIRRWIVENDWLEGVVALPDQMFYNTEIGTYIWILTNRKQKSHHGRVKLIDARDMGIKLRQALGEKRKELTQSALDEITRLYSEAFEVHDDHRVKILSNEDLGYARVTIERPLRRIWKIDEEARSKFIDLYGLNFAEMSEVFFQSEDEAKTYLASLGVNKKQISGALKIMAYSDPSAAIVLDKNMEVTADPDLRDTANVALPKDYLSMSPEEKVKAVEASSNDYLVSEVLPYVSDAWIDHSKTRIGFEIPFTKQFYVYVPPRSVAEIQQEMIENQLKITQFMETIS